MNGYRALEQVIVNRSESNRLTLLSTHIAPYAAKLCNRAVVVIEGKVSELEKWGSLDYQDRLDLIEERFFGAT